MYTVGRLSQIQVVGKPNEVQFAFGGYKNAIEHFVSATANKTKYLTSAEQVPLPSSYVPTVPLPLPSLVVRIGAAVKGKLLERLLLKLAPEGIGAAKLGGTEGTAFEILRPSWTTVFAMGPNAFNRQCGRLDGRAQFGDLLLFKPIYQFIDAFLATNTYPYKKVDFSSGSTVGSTFVNMRLPLEMRGADGLWRPGFGSKAPKRLKLALGVAREEPIDDMEPTDLTPHLDTMYNVHQSVTVAKPSPLPSSTSWGSPSSVPALGGLLFPYFPGMLQHDLPGARDIIGRLMFRCLGDESTSPRDAYANIRNKMGSVLNTDAGLILHHVLKGMDLALDCQAQLFLVFDKETYLGFCLLGEEFSVWVNGRWHAAESPELLRASLSTLATAEQALEQLAAKLRELSVDMDGLDSITPDGLQTSYDILSALSRLQISDDEKGTAITKELFSIIGKCNMSGNYLSVSPENVKWAIEQLTVKKSEAFDKMKFPIYIPPSGWSGLFNKPYVVLASFGPRSISFRNSKGDEFKIPDIKDDKCKWAQKDGKQETFGLYIYIKTILEAVADWETLVETGKLRVDFTERAGAVRAHRWMTDKKKMIWQVLWENKDHFGIGAAPGSEESEKAKGKKKAVDIPVDIDELEKYL
jgi:hypothetical protein